MAGPQDRKHDGISSGTLAVAAGIAAATVASALFNVTKARQAEQENPPTGKFLEIDGVRLHYLEHGEGRPLILLHGNGVSLADMEASGLLSRAAQRYRVIAFDRPGYGHSTRPRDRTWSPEEQAELLWTALRSLGVAGPIILGHSWGTLVALAMALDHPGEAAALVLVSGYYYPTRRMDALLSPPALPVVGDAMRYTVSPLLARLVTPALVERMFAPASVPESFAAYPIELSLRPSQLRAASAEAGMMVGAAARLSKRYNELDLPIIFVSGDGDRIVEFDQQSKAMHDAIPGSQLRVVEGGGHMIHYLDPDAIVAAIDAAAARSPFQDEPQDLPATEPLTFPAEDSGHAR
jgi:pimeloyl-ACP methyl ester carboxylesterase